MGPKALLHWKRVPMHFLVMLSICVLNVSLLSSVIPRSLTSLQSSIVSPQTSMGSRKHFLFHVNMTIFVLSALMLSPLDWYQFSIVCIMCVARLRQGHLLLLET